MEWEGVDGPEEVTLIFLLAIPPAEAGSTHIEVLTALTSRLADDDLRARVMAATTAEGVLTALDAAPGEQADAIGRRMLEKVGLADRADYYPRQLSGGQQQRVAIARALATDPEIIYFDEPTSALDPELTGEVLSVMRQLAEEGMTMLVVTHEMGFARNVSSKTVFMENGVVVEQAPSREFFADPKEERTRAFLQKIAHTE
ncbi:MAG: ATP-binding cassette domain-containing protein [Faecalibacterium sp.]|nr:ATP-binding cassette domain-containing protein [Faecalibacterium sp.]